MVFVVKLKLFFQKVPENEDDLDDETQALITADFEIGEFIRQRLIPRAVLYFTGEALDEEYDEEDEEDDEEDEEMDDEEDDKDFEPEHQAKGKPKHAKGSSGGNKKENPQECKQQ